MHHVDISSFLKLDLYWNPQILRNIESSPYFFVYGGIDDWNDCKNDDFYLKSSLFLEKDKESISGKLKYFEILLNGSRNVFDLDNPWEINIRVNNSAILGHPEYFAISSINQEYFQKSPRIARLAIFALADKETSYLLQIFQHENSFQNFYKIAETIEKFTFPDGSKISIDKNLLTRFKYTANNPNILGPLSRHGQNGQEVSKNLVAMDLKEAHKFIHSLFIDFINKKYKTYQSWV